MTTDPLLRLLLMPLALLYGIGVSIRNFLYRRRILLSVRFNLPVIGVGSLTVGGAGKSPHVEYLTRLLLPYLETGILSRGYGRKTSGFRWVEVWNKAEETGDEPLMIKRKFPEAKVAVSESRSLGIPRMLQRYGDLQVVLLDDAFQHLGVNPGLNILLTEYRYPYTRDWLLPAGRLREWPSGSRRADIIVVTKCPPDLDENDRQHFIRELAPLPHQQVFFSSYRYTDPYYLFNPRYRIPLADDIEVLLVCAIANAEYLEEYLVENTASVRTLSFDDHHFFDERDLYTIGRYWQTMTGSRRLIVTTEKDAVRLEPHREWILQAQWPIVVLPVEVFFLPSPYGDFDESIRRFLLDFKV